MLLVVLLQGRRHGRCLLLFMLLLMLRVLRRGLFLCFPRWPRLAVPWRLWWLPGVPCCGVLLLWRGAKRPP